MSLTWNIKFIFSRLLKIKNAVGLKPFSNDSTSVKHKTPTHVSTVCRSTISLSSHLSLRSLEPFSECLSLWSYVSCEPKRNLFHPEYDRSTACRFSPLQAILVSQTFRFTCDQKTVKHALRTITLYWIYEKSKKKIRKYRVFGSTKNREFCCRREVLNYSLTVFDHKID